MKMLEIANVGRTLENALKTVEMLENVGQCWEMLEKVGKELKMMENQFDN